MRPSISKFPLILQRWTSSSKVQAGHVYFVSTPIGNLDDISLRAIQVLKHVDIIAAEDTRRTGKALELLEIPASRRLVSFHDHNWRKRIGGLLVRVQSGSSLALVTDAGTPGIADPGAELADVCHASKVPVVPIPGPSAVVVALSVAGFDSSHFTFFGFLAKQKGQLERTIDEIMRNPRTCVLYETPHRISSTLDRLILKGKDFQVDRSVVICRELTKKYENVQRYQLSSLNTSEIETRGEFVVVLGPIDETNVTEELALSMALKRVQTLHSEGLRLSTAVRIVSEEHGLRKKLLYSRAVSEIHDRHPTG